MPSSVIAHFAYDRARETLTIRFVSGRVYAYFGVPPAIAAELAAASTKGGYFNAVIRDRFPYRELPTASAA